MNTHNNKRRKESQEKIEKVFIELIQKKEIEEISVTDICKLANLNRSTFYANYIDIYDLADKIKDKMVDEFFNIYTDEAKKNYHSYDFLKLFYHIKENQLFYKTYFKLNFDLINPIPVELIDEKEVERFIGSSKNLEYHIEFFKAGLNAILKKWLNGGCKESPEEIDEIIKSEYKNKKFY